MLNTRLSAPFSTSYLPALCAGLTPTTAASDLLAEVKQKKAITIGTEAQFSPFEFVQDGKIVGYSADLLDTIMTELPGVAAKRQDVPFQAILAGLAAKNSTSLSPR